MPRRPIVLIHGYSANSTAFASWHRILQGWGYSPNDIHVCNYVSLSDEVTIADLARGFEDALQGQPGLDEGEAFDAIVHSTGMLVLRSWLALAPERRARLKHLVGLAPASFGSPLAHKGRTYLGRAIRGNPVEGPDFREAGDKILSALELGSKYTWELAHKDLLGSERFYGDSGLPFVSVFCGTDGYKGIMSVVNEPGTDGTVRLAGAALNTRKIEIDLRDSVKFGKRERYRVADWSNANIPVVPVARLNHGTIMSAPTAELQELVRAALGVQTTDDYEAWLERVSRHSESVQRESWQQIVFRVVDENGTAVDDYFIDFHYRQGEEWKSLGEAMDKEKKLAVHPYTDDPSYRCFHFDTSKLPEAAEEWAMTVHAFTGTAYVESRGWVEAGLVRRAKAVNAVAAIFLPRQRNKVEFFHPHTTTLVEITIDRAPAVAPTDRPVSFVDTERRLAAREDAERAERELQKREDELRRNGRMDEIVAGWKKE